MTRPQPQMSSIVSGDFIMQHWVVQLIQSDVSLLDIIAGSLRWMLKILHDPTYPKPWDFWYYSILRPCRNFRTLSILNLGSYGTIVY